MEHRTTIGNPGVNPLPRGAYEYSNSKVKDVLEMEFRPFKQTLIDTIRSMLDIEREEIKATD
jgi:hypothetical protein